MGSRRVKGGKNGAYVCLGQEISIKNRFFLPRNRDFLKSLFEVLIEALYVLLAILKILNHSKILIISIFTATNDKLKSLKYIFRHI